MSEDIVKKLRVLPDLMTDFGRAGLFSEAAAEIERLREQNERLRARLEDLEREMRFLGRLDYPLTRLSAEIARLRVRNAKLEKVREAAEAWRADMALPVDHLRTARTGLYLITALDEVTA